MKAEKQRRKSREAGKQRSREAEKQRSRKAEKQKSRKSEKQESIEPGTQMFLQFLLANLSYFADQLTQKLRIHGAKRPVLILHALGRSLHDKASVLCISDLRHLSLHVLPGCSMQQFTSGDALRLTSKKDVEKFPFGMQHPGDPHPKLPWGFIIFCPWLDWEFEDPIQGAK